MAKFDIYLNGLGYLLMRDGKGRLMDGAAREQAVDPFSSHLTEDKWQTAVFKFGEGAGRKDYDGTGRYRWGLSADTRGGRLILGPQVVYTPGSTNAERIDEDVENPDLVIPRHVRTGAGWNRRVGFQFWPNGKTYRSFGIMVRRDSTVNYAAALPFQVQLWTDLANAPDALIGGATVDIPLLWQADEWLPDEDAWLSGDWFWCWGNFPAPVTPATNPCWLVVENAQDLVVQWGYDDSSPNWVNIGLWADPAGPWTIVGGQRPFVKLYPVDEVDREAGAFYPFRGSDNYRRLYAGVGPKVMYYDEEAGAWANSKPNASPSPIGDGFAGRVTDLCPYNGRLLAAQGGAGSFWQTTGSSAVADWSDGGRCAYCFCVHDDRVWRAYQHMVWPGDQSWPIGWKETKPNIGIPLGDPGTPVTALCSHDGKLYGAKPEGIWRIDYPAGDYYKWNIEDANAVLVLDLSADRAGRPWMVSWEGGLYFPAAGGVMEWKNGTLQNIWSLYMDGAAARNVNGINCGYRGWWRSCEPTANGLLLGFQSNYREVSQYWLYQAGEWHPVCCTDPAGSLDMRYGRPVGAVTVDSRGGGVGALYLGVGARIARSVWPTWTRDATLDTSCRYVGTCYVTLPTVGLDVPHRKKDWRGVRLLSSGLGSHIGDPAVTVKYRMDDGPVWLTAGDAQASPSALVAFPAGTASYMLDVLLQVHGKAGLAPDPSVTPIIESATVLYQDLPDTVRQWSYWIAGREFDETRGGASTGRTVRAVIAELAALQELTEPFSFIDEFGSVHSSVRVMGVTRQDTSLYYDAGAAPGLMSLVGFMVTLCEV